MPRTSSILEDMPSYPMIDTHTHFDAPTFDHDRLMQAKIAYQRGVHHLVLVGYLHTHFERLYACQQALSATFVHDKADMLDNKEQVPKAHIALGLHPFYIDQHTEAHLSDMAHRLNAKRPLAIGEIGLDTYTDAMKAPDMFAKQKQFFKAQLDMAVTHQLPVMLHIRKAHADTLAILKAHKYDAHTLGGVAHSFSGGEQEAKAFVKLGFKLGVTGQVSNPNAKKLRRAIVAAVATYGTSCLVIETDCPDMMPIMCQQAQVDLPASGQSPDDEWQGVTTHNRNVPANLPWVLLSLSELLDVTPEVLAQQLWQNSCMALKTSWTYPTNESL
ncbi:MULTISPECIES: TatD family hydrolase [unclassified Psychrobacter]|uniref:TatD family hydrolase n=1 Tax=unclassified Psychrobacter TaxID=196806 RepID=UPI00293D2822|nr:TatD family hydrolase [uncultured Psychrobacter sp.]